MDTNVPSSASMDYLIPTKQLGEWKEPSVLIFRNLNQGGDQARHNLGIGIRVGSETKWEQRERFEIQERRHIIWFNAPHNMKAGMSDTIGRIENFYFKYWYVPRDPNDQKVVCQISTSSLRDQKTLGKEKCKAHYRGSWSGSLRK